ncbi:hypothetical protein GCM10010517_39540 [Streptosporangium fragile]|uniref:Uncharacterized protein n=1 Tax=Streptosporangium fragile TaxID=46186 RepID=A0ABP6IF91_9ACTN
MELDITVLETLPAPAEARLFPRPPRLDLSSLHEDMPLSPWESQPRSRAAACGAQDDLPAERHHG